MNRFARTSLAAFGSCLILSASFAKRPSGKGPSSVDHTASQSGPIQLGTSGGWEYDLANGYCCGGTLGSLVRFGDGSLHILSNFHVLAADVELGGNGVVATFTDPVVHPALIDANCAAGNTRPVALLSAAADPIGEANIDAATAQILDGEVSARGEILEIGEISDVTLAATPGLAVKKSGRTTGLTRSTVAFLDAEVSVRYDSECAGSDRGPASFTGQIVINNSGSSFLAGGDSGSLMVEDVSDHPRAVGLLFAGSSTHAIANPIDEVLAHFGASMVGTPGSGGTGGDGETTSPGRGNGGSKKKGSSELARGIAANKKAAAFVKRVSKSVGHGVGIDESGAVYVAVFVESLDAAAAASVPAAIDGVPVKLVETGVFVAF